MKAQNALKWTAMLVIVAGWILAPAPRFRAQTADQRAPGLPKEETRRSFDETITVPELFDKAREAFGLNKIDLAEEFYQEILIRERSNVQAMMELSNVYERSGQLEYARGLLVRSAKLAPDNSAISERLASVEHMLTIVLSAEVDSLLASKQYELAIPKISVHLSIEPGNAELLYKKALCYANLGRPDAAISSIDRALQIDPQERYYRLRTDILEDLKSMESREKVSEVKKLLRSGTPEDQQRALEILGAILQVNPDHEWARAEFVRLSGDETAQAEGGDETAEEGIRGTLDAVARSAGKALRTTLDLVRRHLSALLLLIAAYLVFRSPLTRRITKWLAPKAYMSGRFPKFTLTEILIMLNTESHTGILQVKGESCRGKIYIENGEPCHCIVGKLDGPVALHHLLSSTRTGQFEFVDGSIPLKRSIDTPLSIVLVDQKSGGPGGAARRRAKSDKKSNKAKSRMKEMLESRSSK